MQDLCHCYSASVITEYQREACRLTLQTYGTFFFLITLNISIN